MTLKTLAAVAVLTTATFGALVLAGRIGEAPEPAATAVVEPVQTPAPIPGRGASLPAAGTLPDLSSVAEAALGVSANITSTNVVRQRDPLASFFYDEPRYLQSQSQSLGSGVVVSSDGLVLTNTHVIRGNTSGTNPDIRVTLSDGRERRGTIVGVDDLSDLAVVRIDAKGLPTLPWGDSSKLRVAEWVLAIGNPFQLSGTVTLGIISTVSRSQSGAVTDFIQTDAAINQGNSGGALVNARGELVGINSMIYSETGGNLGIGFAIPANLARRIMNELVTQGAVHWGSIGYVEWVDPSVARRFGYGETGGPMVGRMFQSSPAYRGGLRPEDIVLTFNGQKVASGDQLDRLIADSRVGTRAKVEVERERKRITLDIPIESRQQQPQLRRRR
jgi:serine protease Do